MTRVVATRSLDETKAEGGGTVLITPRVYSYKPFFVLPKTGYPATRSLEADKAQMRLDAIKKGNLYSDIFVCIT